MNNSSCRVSQEELAQDIKTSLSHIEESVRDKRISDAVDDAICFDSNMVLDCFADMLASDNEELKEALMSICRIEKTGLGKKSTFVNVVSNCRAAERLSDVIANQLKGCVEQ